MAASVVLFSSFFGLLLIGAPIVIALGGSAMLVYLLSGEDYVSLVQTAWNAVDSFPIMALPAFILSGALMQASGISRRLVHIAELLAGPMAGGLGFSAILASMFFGAISGSGPATTAAVGMLMIPALADKGYNKGYAAALTASSGGLGVVIPPSIPMVIYGVTASESIGKLFIAGVIPGVMLAGGLMIANYMISKKNGYVGASETQPGELGKACKDGIWSILAPLVILGGIYSGLFTPTEAAVVSVFYTLFVGKFIHRELTLDGLKESLSSTTWLTGRVLIIMFAATAFGRILVENDTPAAIASSLLALTDSLALIWLVVILFLILIGMFMETLATIMIVTPVLLPVMVQLGVDPIHFGVVLVCCCEIGFSTPPLGENMFISSSIAKVTIEEISVKALPFVLIEVLVVFLMSYFPDTVLWLPSLMGY
ncbi:TRAP transporter large permease [Enterovibrio norvegicus]|uniref:TRAP transporter large permease protein n=2 Tax=Enterovibrio norvegicus TaxID=188144 RepID=A0A2N7L7D4_9GAMM|nr:TRAP transporter large permease [Enterovibrio norvegicus]OEE60739.1 C4-dicarboxylate ABC transporter permease [Enterovibrio norvegicus]OEF56770.1 C4-dicarboxylate ABC transporter permease [Enterovibrio norvegicus]OEF63808.1 C4-dicarboxylate ABC transporter permease [Enterovibrio norvegicus]PMH67244.1 C4-dicarboxylate ABC transporter permease [Enterovibrio norvegicus]PMI31798.1 C4-dicarboxylate ABC transporter permease [Enterovibrio norvegicus]